jgi:hypothetical protein
VSVETVALSRRFAVAVNQGANVGLTDDERAAFLRAAEKAESFEALPDRWRKRIEDAEASAR